ncbi:SGNH/GDSL hydrolase family protein [Rhodoligotrophos defluvii]|uniref:SGNH/GDSL hydrolase family protein n=1 Tax=Rhodoligotrophos defluvii TaxID=2561934 RepID=UPI0010C941BD|nr:SGNH/GDSL hydrolase family protein [Rhodoligotrophos defluvii]
MRHVVLLGDSVFDNAAYVIDGPDVITHVRHRLPAGWQATLVAADGGVMADIPRQLARLPEDTTHLVVSIGGNDALGEASILEAPSRSVADTLLQLTEIRRRFQVQYAAMLDAVLERGLPTAICTIYDPRYPDPVQRQIGTTALMVLNDAIIREAALRHVPILDLRLICNDDADFANPIEPSAQGGGKIAAAIASLLAAHDFSAGRSAIYAR